MKNKWTSYGLILYVCAMALLCAMVFKTHTACIEPVSEEIFQGTFEE